MLNSSELLRPPARDRSAFLGWSAGRCGSTAPAWSRRGLASTASCARPSLSRARYLASGSRTTVVSGHGPLQGGSRRARARLVDGFSDSAFLGAAGSRSSHGRSRSAGRAVAWHPRPSDPSGEGRQQGPTPPGSSLGRSLPRASTGDAARGSQRPRLRPQQLAQAPTGRTRFGPAVICSLVLRLEERPPPCRRVVADCRPSDMARVVRLVAPRADRNG
jgi:hypothetical protein